MGIKFAPGSLFTAPKRIGSIYEVPSAGVEPTTI